MINYICSGCFFALAVILPFAGHDFITSVMCLFLSCQFYIAAGHIQEIEQYCERIIKLVAENCKLHSKLSQFQEQNCNREAIENQNTVAFKVPDFKKESENS